MASQVQNCIGSDIMMQLDDVVHVSTTGGWRALCVNVPVRLQHCAVTRGRFICQHLLSQAVESRSQGFPLGMKYYSSLFWPKDGGS